MEDFNYKVPRTHPNEALLQTILTSSQDDNNFLCHMTAKDDFIINHLIDMAVPAHIKFLGLDEGDDGARYYVDFICLSYFLCLLFP